MTAVLDRDPAAVAALRAELVRRRDAAAGRLAFEFAGQVQAELEALDWITAEQKVTVAQPCDFDVYGWADGMLVRFEVRGGRLSGWSQRACGAAAARRHLAATSGNPAWADFARRTAELAAACARRSAELAARWRSPRCRTSRAPRRLTSGSAPG